jgi:predicted DNA-binding helix-hairpin-helix protein
MGRMRLAIEDRNEPVKVGRAKPRKFATGQSTQLIVGADAARDGDILARSAALYGSYQLKRVYYSAFSPIPDGSVRLPLVRPPLVREHRLYQADWLMRFYGFGQGEIVAPGEDLDLRSTPRPPGPCAIAATFPVDVNTADRETLLRTPGLGARGVDRILQARAQTRLTLDDVKRVCGSVKRAKPFIVTADWTPGAATDGEGLRASLLEPQQLSLF